MVSIYMRLSKETSPKLPRETLLPKVDFLVLQVEDWFCLDELYTLFHALTPKRVEVHLTEEPTAFWCSEFPIVLNKEE